MVTYPNCAANYDYAGPHNPLAQLSPSRYGAVRQKQFGRNAPLGQEEQYSHSKDRMQYQGPDNIQIYNSSMGT